MAAQNREAPRLTEVRNSKVFRDFEVGQRFEAGIQLHGTEVKSIRTGRAQISDGFSSCSCTAATSARSRLS